MRLGIFTTLPVIIGVAAGLAVAPGDAQELRVGCDANHDGAVTSAEANSSAARRFDFAGGAADGRAEEQFAAALPDANALREQFAQADEDGDGRISRDEWMAWFGPAHAGTTDGAGSRPVGSD